MSGFYVWCWTWLGAAFLDRWFCCWWFASLGVLLCGVDGMGFFYVWCWTWLGDGFLGPVVPLLVVSFSWGLEFVHVAFR